MHMLEFMHVSLILHRCYKQHTLAITLSGTNGKYVYKYVCKWVCKHSDK